MIYVDTSVIVKLYIREKFSRKVSEWVSENNEAIPLTNFHVLEFRNALHLKEFQGEISDEQIQNVMENLDNHQEKGVYYRPQLNWTEILGYAHDLSQRFTALTGARTLDILHVASALSMKVEKFFSLDGRQVKLASLAGLQIEKF